MASPINSELEENYNKRRILQVVFGFMFLAFVALIALNPSDRDFILVSMLMAVIMIIALSQMPYLSKYDLIRYHLKKLIELSKSGHTKKFKKHVNKLAKNISEFNRELDDIFLLSPTKQILDKFLILLRYQNDPHLTEFDINSYSETLEEIYIAMDDEKRDILNETLVTFIEEMESQQSTGLFAYETPNILERFIKKTMHLIQNNKGVNFTVKFILIFIVFISLAYFLSPKLSYLDFDSTTIEVSFVGALAFASQI